MSKTGSKFFSIAFVLAATLLASAIMLMVTPNDSWLAFTGWAIFFLAMQSPFYLLSQSSKASCAAWLNRLFRQN
jgi:hypothetical protein